MSSSAIEQWVRAEYRRLYCDRAGEFTVPMNIDKFRNMLLARRPNSWADIAPILTEPGKETALEVCRGFDLDQQGRFPNPIRVASTIRYMRPEMDPARCASLVKDLQERNMADVQSRRQSGQTRGTAMQAPGPTVQSASIKPRQVASHVQDTHPGNSQGKETKGTSLSSISHNDGKQDADELQAAKMIALRLRPAVPAQGPIQREKSELSKAAENDGNSTFRKDFLDAFPSFTSSTSDLQSSIDDVFADTGKQLKHVRPFQGEHNSSQESSSSDNGQFTFTWKREVSLGPDLSQVIDLLPDQAEDCDVEERSVTALQDIQHAPLLSEDLITEEFGAVLPQYGFLGIHENTKLFLNTNVPFSAFICGVQGSGKSHTTSCIMENALIPSKNLGRLETPLSALVFSYGNLSGGGSSMNVSEAAFLGAPHPSFPAHGHVEKVTVLYPESNPSLARVYKTIPSVSVMPFKIKPKHLDIGTILTLMNVDGSNTTPLYMSQVTKILRDMAVRGQKGVNYEEFKFRLAKCDFIPSQQQMLDMRLDVLDSFLDVKDVYPEPTFSPGEITIMDMSCPFVDATTACVLFNIVLKRYLQTQSTGKMVVLDEAHKYILKNPGAQALTAHLVHTIRLQRHFGTRVIISTQEPTLLTDLIALCSVTVIHRFSSPEWFAALKRHIPMAGLDQAKLLQEVEGLRTGAGLVYSSSAVLGKDEEGALIKGTGRLLRVVVRKRVTADGGASIMAI